MQNELKIFKDETEEYMQNELKIFQDEIRSIIKEEMKQLMLDNIQPETIEEKIIF